MKIASIHRLALLTWLLLLCGLLCNTASAKAAMSAQERKALWQFTNAKQLQRAIPLFLNNPRAIYYIIMRASKRKLAPQAAVTYYEIARKHDEHYANAAAAYAFANYMSTGLLSGNSFTYKASPLIQRLRDQWSEAEDYRQQSLSLQPNSPEFLIMAAIKVEYQDSAPKPSIEYARRATKLAPDWADAHYWLGTMVSQSLFRLKGKARTIAAQESLAAYRKAEKLQPALHGECVKGYMYVYSDTNRPELALRYMNAYIKLRPDFLNNKGNVRWRNALQQQLQQR